MSIFADYASRYYEVGLSAIPVNPKTKQCNIIGWTEKFSKRFPTKPEQKFYINKYGDWNIGLALGESSGVVAIDFDYEGMDKKAIENLVLGILPPSPYIKKGSKGWTRFYKFDGQLKNTIINRGNQRMVDVLSTGRLTVMPPSIHPSGMEYKWIGIGSIVDGEDDIPEISKPIIDKIIEVSNIDLDSFTDIGVNKLSRHDKCVGYIIRISDECSDIDELTTRLIEYDQKANGKDKKGPYFNDEKYLGGKQPYTFARDLALRVCDWKQRKKKEKGIHWEIGKYPRIVRDGKKPSTNYEDFASFFKFNFSDVRFCKVKKAHFTFNKILNKWEPIENKYDYIESLAADAGLSPSYVKRHLARWLEYFEPRLLIDIPRWDGKDRLGEVLSRVDVINIEHEYFVQLIKQWCANIFRRLDNPLNQNACLILRGDQGIGKDRLINFLFSCFKQYYSEIALQPRKIENYQTVSDLLVANIGEFDATLGFNLADFKTLITSPGANFRAAYARKATYVDFYYSFVSTVNFDDILKDSSGNRRFIIFNLNKIEWTYDHINKDQLLAQYYYLYKSDYRASKQANEAMGQIIHDMTPISNEQLFLEAINDKLKRMKSQNQHRVIRWSDIEDVLMNYASRKTFQFGLRRMQSIMKNHGITCRDLDSVYYEPNT